MRPPAVRLGSTMHGSAKLKGGSTLAFKSRSRLNMQNCMRQKIYIMVCSRQTALESATVLNDLHNTPGKNALLVGGGLVDRRD